MSTRSTRYPVQFRVAFSDGSSVTTGAIYDVSESGMFIETPEMIEAGTRVRISPLQSETTPAFEIEAIVVRRSVEDIERFGRVPGIGVQFENVSQHALWALRKMFDTATWEKP